MTLEEIYYISQIVAVVAILGSLVAIWFQMRQNHAIERANAQRDVLNQTREWWLLGIESEEMFDTICAGLQDFNGLNRFQKARFHAWAANLQQMLTAAFFQHRSRLINPSSHEGFVRAFLAVLNTPGGRTWWETYSKLGNSEVNSYINTRLAADGPAVPLWTDLLPFFKPQSAKPGEPA